MARTPAIRGASSRLIKSMRQQQAVTGNRMSPDQIRAIVSGELDVEAGRSLEGARFEESKRQFDIQNEQREDAIAAEKRSSALTGAAQMGSMVYQAAVINPEKIALQRAHAGYLKAQTAGITGTQAVGGAADAAAAAGAIPGAAAIPETFASAATGEAISTATGTAAGGVGVLGTAMAGFGALSMGQVASEYGGKGKGKLVSGVAAGAAYGSIVPGIGTVIGGVLGGLGAAAGGDTVICAELHRQGYMPKHILDYDSAYRKKHITIEEYIGYRLFADPVVGRMRESRLTTLAIKPFALSWAYTMANKMDKSIKVNLLRRLVGSLILLIGLPYCRHKSHSALKGGICDA